MSDPEVFDPADASWSSVSGDHFEHLMLYKDDGKDYSVWWRRFLRWVSRGRWCNPVIGYFHFDDEESR